MKTLEKMLMTRQVVVVVGSGGVGKTTNAALLGLHAAIQGRRVLVMTIDPARRLANALGVDSLEGDIEQIHLDRFRDFDVTPTGEFWATMLDMKSAFDSIIERNVRSEKERQEIFNNRFYHFFSTSLAGAQELSATDRLLDVVQSGRYDLIVLDTPPTINALDFLDAPARFADALDNETIRWFIDAGRKAVKATGFVNIGTGLVIRTLGKFTGVDFFKELGEFLYHLNHVLVGFHDRSKQTQELLIDGNTSFIIVTSPDPATVREANFFQQKLRSYGVKLEGVIVNRVRQMLPPDAPLDAPAREIADRLMQLASGAMYEPSATERLAEKMKTNAQDFNRLAQIDKSTIAGLVDAFGDEVAIRSVPMYAQDIHSLEGLERVRRDLFDLESLDAVLDRLRNKKSK